jgi:hypothetical protein
MKENPFVLKPSRRMNGFSFIRLAYGELAILLRSSFDWASGRTEQNGKLG